MPQTKRVDTADDANGRGVRNAAAFPCWRAESLGFRQLRLQFVSCGHASVGTHPSVRCVVWSEVVLRVPSAGLASRDAGRQQSRKRGRTPKTAGASEIPRRPSLRCLPGTAVLQHVAGSAPMLSANALMITSVEPQIVFSGVGRTMTTSEWKESWRVPRRS